MSDIDKLERSGEPEKRVLTPAAKRALAEAKTRRASIERKAAELPPERGGPSGKEPVRYGDWEVKGIATDF